MVMKVMYLEGTSAASSTWTKLAYKEGEAGKTIHVHEIRIYASGDGVYLRLFLNTEPIVQTVTTASRSMNLPYPVDFELREGQVLSLEASNPTTSDVNIIVELVYEE